MKFKWYHVLCIICCLSMFSISLMFGILLFCYNLSAKGVIVIVLSVLMFAVILLSLLLLVRADKCAVKNAMGPVMVEAEGLLKVNDNKGMDAFIQFYRNGLILSAPGFDRVPYVYRFVSYDSVNTHKYHIVMYIEDLGKCKFTSNSALKIKAIGSILNKYSDSITGTEI